MAYVGRHGSEQPTVVEGDTQLGAITNYIYLYHTKEWLVLPETPDQVTDSMTSTFSQTNALSRTAPVFSYSNSGPRTVQIQLNLHRDMMAEANEGVATFEVPYDSDYVTELIKRLQSIALPVYEPSWRGVVPPMVAMRIGNEIFVRGVVQGGVSVVYQKPILANDHYAQVTVNFQVYEVDAYDAKDVANSGSFRGWTKAFDDGLYVK